MTRTSEWRTSELVNTGTDLPLTSTPPGLATPRQEGRYWPWCPRVRRPWEVGNLTATVRIHQRGYNLKPGPRMTKVGYTLGNAPGLSKHLSRLPEPSISPPACPGGSGQAAADPLILIIWGKATLGSAPPRAERKYSRKTLVQLRLACVALAKACRRRSSRRPFATEYPRTAGGDRDICNTKIPRK